MAVDTTMIAGTRALPRALQRVDLMRMDEGADGFHRSWIMLFPEGTFHHPQYGKLNFTRAKLSEIKANFDNRVRHIDIALDVDHKGGGEDSRATGWIEALDLREGMLGLSDGAGLWGCIKWTPYGQRLLADEEYRYFSPEFGPWTDPETGAEYDNVLIGGGLTNRPFLKVMPAASLPDSAFLDSANRRLPVYEGTGPMVNGRYTKRGKLNIHGLEAALGAVHGAHTGRAMSGLPAGTEERIRRLLAKHGGSGGGEGAASKAASEGRGTMARFKTVDGAVVFSDGQLEYTSMTAADTGAVMLASKKATPPDEDANDEGDEAIDKVAAEPTDETDQTYDDMGDEEYAEGDDADGEPDGVPNPVDKGANRHSAMTTDGHSHGKFGKHSHDGDADHADAALKMSDPVAGLTFSELQAEHRRLLEVHAAERKELYEHQVRKQLSEFRRASAVQLDEEGNKSDARFALSRSFQQEYSALMLSEVGMTFTESQRRAVNTVITSALSARAIVPLGAPSHGEWAAGTGEIGNRTEKASDKQRGSHQMVRLSEEQDRLVHQKYGVSAEQMRWKAQRGDNDAAVKLSEALQEAANNIDYKGL